MRAVRILVVGIVQGVGFRPFIYRIASKSRVNGYVKNIGGSAVEIHVEGEEEDIRKFLKAFDEDRPSAAYVESFQLVEVTPLGYSGFKIFESDPQVHRSSMIPPDTSICEDCLREVLDPSSRFYLYPFHSCAYCGPRYSMIENIPYDRKNTSMKDFPLCSRCYSEYTDPDDRRRFHAQGISCPECGPLVKLYTRNYEYIDEGYDAIKSSAKLIDEGYIIAVKGLGGYHIAASATLEDVVTRLRIRKKRPSKPFAVMVLDIETASKIVHLTDDAISLLLSKEKPIVLLDIIKDSKVSGLVAPGLRQLGIFLPYTALHYLLLKNTLDKFAIMTSGNPKDEPMCTDEDCARRKLSEYVDYFLIHNRRIINRVDDSVVRFSRGRPMLLRRGRGYTPAWSKLPFRLKRPIIAFGAMLQSTGAIGFDDRAILTQYIGDIDEYNCFRDLERYISFLVKSYRIDVKSSIITADLHPRYPSTLLAEAWAREKDVKLFKVQHHWAHITSVMAEHHIDEEVVGIAVDGLGYGLDGTLWGGEVLIADYSDFKRVGHLELQPMPGGDLAVRYPARMLGGILSKVLNGKELINLFRKLGIVEKGFQKGEMELEMMLTHINNSPKTSSIGRVLDATSTLLGLCFERTYEGEPAIRLEASSEKCEEMLNVKILDMEDQIIDTTSIIMQAVELLENGVNKGRIGYMVQKSLGYGLGLIASKSAKRRHRYLVLSGGAAVNEFIIEGVEEAIKESGLRLLLPEKYPANDGGIALGQLAIAGYMVREEI
ncbi:MAG: carbamoyltransferase HypF [Candidatus Caldarchaeales archaeon]